MNQVISCDYQLIFDEESQEYLADWMKERTKNYYPNARYLGMAKNGEVIGCVAYEVFSDKVFTHIAFDKALPKFYIKAIFDYPFKQLGFEKIHGLIRKDNLKAIKVAEKFGFQSYKQDEIYKMFELTRKEFEVTKWATL